MGSGVRSPSAPPPYREASQLFAAPLVFWGDAQRTQAALDEIARQGRGRSRFLPFGLRSAAYPEAVEMVKGDRSPLVVHEPERRILDRIIGLRGEGLGPRRIAARLESEGTQNPRTGCPFYPGLVSRIVSTFDRRAVATTGR